MNLESSTSPYTYISPFALSSDSYHLSFTQSLTPQLLIHAHNGQILDANPSACAFYGYDHSLLCSMNISKINGMGNAELVKALSNFQFIGSDAFRRRHTLASGELRWVAVTSTTFGVEDTPIVHSIIQDITEQVEAEAALLESEARYRLLADHATDVIACHNPQGLYTYASPAAQALFGYSPAELLGQSAYNFFHSQDIPNIQQAHQQSLNTQESSLTQYRFQHKDGHYIWVETAHRSIRDAETGEVQSIIALTRDITARKHREIQLKTQNAIARLFTDPTLVNEHIPRHFLQILCTELDWIIGEIWWPDKTSGHLRCQTTWHIESLDFEDFKQRTAQLTLVPGAGLPGRVWNNQQTLWSEDVQTDAVFCGPRAPASWIYTRRLVLPFRVASILRV